MDPHALTCYRCKVCEVFLETRDQFLIHLQGHEEGSRSPSPLFHTATGQILRINELPHAYDLFIPKIHLQPFEDTCRKSSCKLKLSEIKLSNITKSEIKDIIAEANKRQLRRKPKRNYDFSYEDEIYCQEEESEPRRKRKPRDITYHPPGHQGHQLLESEAGTQAEPADLCCNFCNPKREFETIKNCLKHMRDAHHKNGRFRCPNCSFVTGQNLAFRIHICELAPTRVVIVAMCRVCSPNLKLPNHSTFLAHMMEAHQGEDGKFQCPQCGKKSGTTKAINRHVRTHEREQRPRKPTRYRGTTFTCSLCPKSFIHKSLLNIHLKWHKRFEERNSTKPFRCTVCKLGFTIQQNLQRHFHKHMENNPYACKVLGCKAVTTSRYNYSRHMMLHFGIPEVFPCDICGFEFSRPDRLAHHKKTLHRIGITEGEDVPIRYQRRRAKKSRFRIPRIIIINPPQSQTQEDIPPANESDFPDVVHQQAILPKLEAPDPDPNNRINLGSLHLGDADTIKDECAEALQDVDEELAAVAAKTDSTLTEKRFQRTGPSAAIDAGLLENDPVVKQLATVDPEFVRLLHRGHRYTNYGEPDSFPCTICQFPKVSYARIHHLRKHMIRCHPEEAVEQKESIGALPSSAGPVTLTCIACGFQCTTAHELAEHMDEYHKKRKYPCTTCGVGCKSQLHLDRHKARTHYAKPIHKCPICGKGFTRKETVTNHIRRVHAPPPDDPNDLVCTECGRKLSNLISMKQHLKLHSKTRELSYCGICNSKLSCKMSLRRHIQRIHLKFTTLDKDSTERETTETEQLETVLPADLFL